MGSFAAHVKRFALVDVLVLVIIGIATVAVRTAPVHRQHFSPTDPTISRPLKSQTVPTSALIAIVIVGSMLAIALLAFLGWRKYRHTSGSRNVWNDTYLAFRSLLLSLLLTILLTDVVKKLVGRPRPNCLALGKYQDGAFTAPDSEVDEAFQSFPSGHSSSSFAGFVFVSLLLLHHLYPPGLKIRNQSWRVVCSFLPCLLAGYIAISRIFDYWHHPSDVLAGAVLGSSVAILIFNYAFARRPYRANLSQSMDEDDVLPIFDTPSANTPLLAGDQDTTVLSVQIQSP